jgi:hypothetical protein
VVHKITNHDKIIGPDRRAALIQAAADRMSLEGTMRPDAALRYATTAYANGDPNVIVAAGQVWRERPKRKDPAIKGFGPGAALRIVAVDRATGMAESAGGVYVNYGTYLGPNYYLAEWPLDFRADEGQAPQAPAEPPAEDAAPAAQEAEERFDPHMMYLIVGPSFERRMARKDAGEDVKPLDGHMPMIGECYRTELGKDGKSPFVFLDAVAYLRAHLADYLDRWPEWNDLHWHDGRGSMGAGALEFFNELGGEGCETDLAVGAYLGWWLWNRIMVDVVREHGGTAKDYSVMFMWSPDMVDPIVTAVPGADTTEPLTHDHPLAQVAGQQTLI